MLVLPSGQAIPYSVPRPNLPAGGKPQVPTNGSFKVVDDFSEAELRPYWMMLRTPREPWYSLDGGSLVLRPRAVSIGSRGNPSFLARRQQHANASASTVLRYSPAQNGDMAGLVALQSDAYWYFLGETRKDGRDFITLDRRAGPTDPENGSTIAAVPLKATAGAPLYLKIVARGGEYDFYYGYTRGRWQPLKLGEDGTLLSTKRAGGFVGAVFGLYAFAPGVKAQK